MKGRSVSLNVDRVHPLIDVLLLLLFGFFIASQIPALLTGIFRIESVAAITLFTQGSFLLVIWGLLAWRELSFSHVGLRRPEKYSMAAAQVIALFVFLFLVSIGTEAIGWKRDLSNFEGLKGDLGYTIFAMAFYGLLSAGVYEEILFRGYLMHRFADVFGRSRFGWVAGIFFQATIFGFSHFHQGVYGAFYTGGLSLLVGGIYVIWIRNLWVLILAHGIYDAIRMLYLHFTVS